MRHTVQIFKSINRILKALSIKTLTLDSYQKINFFFVAFLLFFGSSPVLAQLKINSQIIDSEERPVAFATVHLSDKSSYSVYTTSDESGFIKLAFSGNNLDTVTLEISHLGYNTRRLEIVVENIPKVISLNERTELISDIVVTAEKPILLQKGDTLKFNLEEIRDSTEFLVRDLIEKLPGVHISEEGKITYNGKEVSELLLDGDNLFGKDYKSIVNNMRAVHINDIELINNYHDNPLYKGIIDSEQLALNMKMSNTDILTGTINLGLGRSSNSYVHKLNTNIFHIRPEFKNLLLGTLTNLNTSTTSTFEHGDDNYLKFPESGIREIPIELSPLGSMSYLGYNSKLKINKTGHFHLRLDLNGNTIEQENRSTLLSSPEWFNYKRTLSKNDILISHNKKLNAEFQLPQKSKNTLFNSSIQVELPGSDLKSQISNIFGSFDSEFEDQIMITHNSKSANRKYSFNNSITKKVTSQSIVEHKLNISRNNENIEIVQSNLNFALDRVNLDNYNFSVNNDLLEYQFKYARYSEKLPTSFQIGVRYHDYLLNHRVSKNELERFSLISIPFFFHVRFQISKYWSLDDWFSIKSNYFVNRANTVNDNNILLKNTIRIKYDPSPNKYFGFSLGLGRHSPDPTDLVQLPSILNYYSFQEVLNVNQRYSSVNVALAYRTHNILKNTTFNVQLAYLYNDNFISSAIGLSGENIISTPLWLNNRSAFNASTAFSKYFGAIDLLFDTRSSFSHNSAPVLIKESPIISEFSMVGTTLKASKKLGDYLAFSVKALVNYQYINITSTYNYISELTTEINYKRRNINFNLGYSQANTYSPDFDHTSLNLIRFKAGHKIQLNKRRSTIMLEFRFPFEDLYSTSNFARDNQASLSSSIADPYLLFSVDIGF